MLLIREHTGYRLRKEAVLGRTDSRLRQGTLRVLVDRRIRRILQEVREGGMMMLGGMLGKFLCFTGELMEFVACAEGKTSVD
jgi:hypothetical protein